MRFLFYSKNMNKYGLCMVCISITVSVVLLFSSCRKKNTTKQVVDIGVSAITLVPQKIEKHLVVGGSVQSVKSVKIFPKTRGTLKKILVKKGDSVKERQVLAYINSSQVGKTFLKNPVNTPIAGKIADIFEDVGNDVFPSTVLFEVIDNSMMSMRVSIPEESSLLIKEGIKGVLQLSALENKKIYVTVYSTSKVFSGKIRNMGVDIRFKNSDVRIKSGMYGKLTLILSIHKDVMVSPKSALKWQVVSKGKDPVQGVFIVKNPVNNRGKALFVPIKKGIEQEDKVEIISKQLSFGDFLIVKGQSSLMNGSSVRFFSLDGSIVEYN